MISMGQYFGKWINSFDANDTVKENAFMLLEAVDALMAEAMDDGVDFPINPHTGSQVSGEQYGGFRPLSCQIGAKSSSHKLGLAVDIYDPKNEIDSWCMENLDKLEKHGIYIEHPDYTNTWCHMTIKPPRSGKRVFIP